MTPQRDCTPKDKTVAFSQRMPHANWMKTNDIIIMHPPRFKQGMDAAIEGILKNVRAS